MKGQPVSTNTMKFILLLAGLVAVVGLMAINTIETNEGMPVITAIVFYAIGNGIASARGVKSEPVFSPKTSDPKEGR